MSILAGKLKFTNWEGEFGWAGWEIQNKVTKLFVKIFRFWYDMSTFQALPSILSPWLKNASLSAPEKKMCTAQVHSIMHFLTTS